MNATKLLKQKGIDPDKLVLQISRKEVMVGIMDAIEEYCPSVKIEKMPEKDLERLIDSLGENIINYHPEHYHPERSAFLCYIEQLKKCGLTDKEEDALDFC